MPTFKAGTVLTLLELNSKKFIAGIQRADKKLAGFREGLDKASQGFSGIAVRAGAAFAGLSAGIALATRTGAKFQDAIVNVGAVAGAAGKDLERLEQIAIDAGESTKFSATEAADAMFNLASQGVKGADAFKNLLAPALDLAAASQTDVAFASETILSNIKAFRLEFSDASKVANIFSSANENSALTVEKLAIALTPVAPIAGALGIEIEQVTGALGILVNAGFDASEAGTALRNIFLRIQKPAGKAKKILDAAGLSIETLGELSKDPVKLITALRDANLSTADSLEIFGTRAVAAFLTLREGVPQMEALTKAITGTDSASRIARVQLTSFGNTTKLLTSKIQTLGIEIFKTLEPALRAMFAIISRVVVSMVGFIRNNRTLVAVIALGATAVTGAITVLAGLAAIVASTAAAFIGFKISLIGFKAVFPGLVAGIKTAAGAILSLKVAGVGLVAVLSFQLGRVIDNFIREKLPNLSNAIDTLIGKFVGLNRSIEDIKGTANDTADRLDKAADGLDRFVGTTGLEKAARAMKKLGLDSKSLPPALREALANTNDWNVAAELLREHAESIRKATELTAEAQKKGREEMEKTLKVGQAPGARGGTGLITGIVARQTPEEKRAEGLKLLEALKEDFAFRDFTRDEEALFRLNMMVKQRILSEQEVASVKMQLEEQIRMGEKETNDERIRQSALMLDRITGMTQAFEDFLGKMIEGNKNLGESIKELGLAILKNLVAALIKAIAKAIILDGILKSAAKSQDSIDDKDGDGKGKKGKIGKKVGTGVGAAVAGPLGAVVGGFLGGLLPFKHGGEIPGGEDGVFAGQAGEFILSRDSVRSLGGANALDSFQNALAGGSGVGGTKIEVVGKIASMTGAVSQRDVDLFVERVIDRIQFRLGSI